MHRRKHRATQVLLLALFLLLPLLIAPHAATAVTAPPYTITRYVSNPSATRFNTLGCSEGQRAASNGLAAGIVILDFGQPVYSAGVYGAYDYGNHWDSISTITSVVESYLTGLWNCLPSGVMKVAVGTSNYQGATTYAHGQAWATMINNINAWITTKGYGSQLAARGANDMEINWNTVYNTRQWVDGYNSVGQYPLYDYGDDAGGTNPGNGWTANDVWYKAWGAAQNWPVPEIYYTADATLDWEPLSLWAYNNKGAKITFLGTLTEYAADTTTLTASGGYNALYNAINSNSATAQSLDYATDITWSN